MEEVTTELSVYLGMLYHMVEVFKGHDDFADELSEQCRLPTGHNADPLRPWISEPGPTTPRLSIQCCGWPAGQKRQGVSCEESMIPMTRDVIGRVSCSVDPAPPGSLEDDPNLLWRYTRVSFR